MTVRALAKENHIQNVNLIRVGQRLQVDRFESKPSKGSSAPAHQTQSAPAASRPASSNAPAAKSALPAGMPNTSNLSQAKKYALYSKYVEKHGDAQAKRDLAAGKRVVVGLRKNTPFTSNQPYRGTYDDRMVVLWKDQGKPQAEIARLSQIAKAYPNRTEVVTKPPVRTTAEAKQLARATLEDQSKRLIEASGASVGLPDLRAGCSVEIIGFGLRTDAHGNLAGSASDFDGEYYVTGSTHTIGGGGYRTQFTARREGPVTNAKQA